MARIGIDRPAGQNVGEPKTWARKSEDLGTVQRADFQELAKALDKDSQLLLVDARRKTEWQEGHVDGARHIPLHDLPEAIGRSRRGRMRPNTPGPIRRSGCRAAAASAMVAASLLVRAGVPVVAVDDDFTATEKAGLIVKDARCHAGQRVHRLGAHRGTLRPIQRCHRSRPPRRVNSVRSGAQLIDVRETGEWNAGHAPQATHIPTGQVDARMNRFKKGKDIVVVCRSGNRSRSVTSKLRKAGLARRLASQAACVLGSPSADK